MYVCMYVQGRTQDFRRGGAERGGGGVPRSAKEANNPILLKVQSLQLSFRPAGVSLGGGGGGQGPPWPPPAYAPDVCICIYVYNVCLSCLVGQPLPMDAS